MAHKNENPDRRRKLDFENGRPRAVDDEDDDSDEDGGDG